MDVVGIVLHILLKVSLMEEEENRIIRDFHTYLGDPYASLLSLGR